MDQVFDMALEPCRVPFFRPFIGQEEKDAIARVLNTGWLTTGKEVKRFENDFANAVCARHAVALNSGTAALHLAVRALGLRAGQGVLVPTMTFAASAEVVMYGGGIPILVDCDPHTLQINLDDAERKLRAATSGTLLKGVPPLTVVGLIPVHVGGMMSDVSALRAFAERHRLWIVEDAAHAFPSAWRSDPKASWVICGQNTADVSCFSFYANKTITTGEGGMAVTDDAVLAARMRQMSLHGLSCDAWQRYSGGGAWDYAIVSLGFKYNLTDIAAALGIAQLARADWMRQRREDIADRYLTGFAELDEIEPPARLPNRIHAWHLFPVRLRLDRLAINRNQFIEELRKRGIGTSVHWRPLHLHPFYEHSFGWTPDQFPVASAQWLRAVSLPIFPSMTEEEVTFLVQTVTDVCRRHALLPQPLVTSA